MNIKVLEVKGPRTWEWNGETNHDYELTLEGQNLPAILTQKPTKRDGSVNPPPVEGQTLDLELSPHKFEGKLKAKRTQAGGAFGGGGVPRAEDPKKAKAIARMAAQKAAVALIHAKAQAGFATEDDFKPSKVAALADWFDADTTKARET